MTSCSTVAQYVGSPRTSSNAARAIASFRRAFSFIACVRSIVTARRRCSQSASTAWTTLATSNSGPVRFNMTSLLLRLIANDAELLEQLVTVDDDVAVRQSRNLTNLFFLQRVDQLQVRLVRFTSREDFRLEFLRLLFRFLPFVDQILILGLEREVAEDHLLDDDAVGLEMRRQRFGRRAGSPESQIGVVELFRVQTIEDVTYVSACQRTHEPLFDFVR